MKKVKNLLVQKQQELFTATSVMLLPIMEWINSAHRADMDLQRNVPIICTIYCMAGIR